MKRLLPTLAALCLLAVLPASAPASQSQTMTFEAPKDLLNPSTRDAALQELDLLGVRALRVVLYWRDVAPAAGEAVKPDFDTTDPANYDWSKYEPVVAAAKARGWRLLLTLSGPVPRWATQDRRDQLTRPDDGEFAQFTAAAARQFHGRVTWWSVWNEPNHPDFLKPQYSSGKRAVSPLLYRRLVKGALRGFRSVGVDPRLLVGETAPIGTGKVVAPLTFLRGAFCLDSKDRRRPGCGRISGIDGYAHHAYTPKEGPRHVPPSRNNVTIGVLSRLTRVLDRAGARGTLPKRLPLYLTEFGIQSTPDPYTGVSLQRQAEYRNLSERIAFDNPRVRTFSQYLLRDDDPVPGVSKFERYGGFESGIKTAAGNRKPSYAAFRLPLSAVRRGSRVSLWGLVRPASGRVSAVLQYRNGSRGAFRRLKGVRTNSRGFFRARTSYRSGRQYRLLWTDPSGRTFNGSAIRVVR